MSGGQSKGLGFVEYTNRADAQKAMDESNGFWLDNRQISVEFSGQKPALNGPTSGAHGEADTVFCGNLGFHTDENTIWEFFGQAGTVASVRIAMNPEDGRPRGFCHVQFDAPAGATAAMEYQGSMLDGRAIRLDLSTPNRNGGGRGGGRGGGFGGGRGGGRGGRGGGFGGGRGRGGADSGAIQANKGAISAYAGTKMSF